MQGLASALVSEEGALQSLLALPHSTAALPPSALEPQLPAVCPLCTAASHNPQCGSPKWYSGSVRPDENQFQAQGQQGSLVFLHQVIAWGNKADWTRDFKANLFRNNSSMPQVMAALVRHIAGSSLEACKAALTAARALSDQAAAPSLAQLFGDVLLPELLLACGDVCSEASTSSDNFTAIQTNLVMIYQQQCCNGSAACLLSTYE